MLLDLAVDNFDSVVALIIASKPPAVLVQAREPGDAALQKAMAKIGATRIGAKFVMSPKRSYTLGDNGWPIGRSAFSPSTIQSIENITVHGDLIVTPRFTEFGLDEPQVGVGIHAFYITTGKVATLCTATPSESERVKPVCLATGEISAASLVALHAMDFNFNAPPATQQARVELAQRSLVFSPEHNEPLFSLLRQPNLLVSVSSDIDPPTLSMLLPNASSLVLVVSPKMSVSTTNLEKLRAAGAKILKRMNDHGGTIVIGSSQAYIGSHRLQSLHLTKSRAVGIMVPTSSLPSLRKVAS